MDSTPPPEPQSRTKSASRLSKLRHYSGGNVSPIPKLSLDIVPSSPRISTPSPASTISPRPPYTLPLQELLLLSPSPLKRSKTRLDAADDAPVEPSGVRKRCKSRISGSGCGVSPRSGRRSRRRLDQDVREEREIVVAGEEILAKPRKKRQSRKEKPASAQIVPSNSMYMFSFYDHRHFRNLFRFFFFASFDFEFSGCLSEFRNSWWWEL